VPDIFDEFLDELKRRQAREGGSVPAGDAGTGGEPPGDADDEGDDSTSGDRREPPEPQPIRRRGWRSRPTSGGRPPREPRSRRREAGRDRRLPLGWIAVVVAVLALLFLSGGVGFWTDVLWYRSVGFESVLWTRVGAVGGLFLLGTALALAVLLGNLFIAERLAPPADPSAGAGISEFLERLNRAASTPPGSRWPPGSRPISVGADAIPDLTPLARLVIVALAILVALTVGGSMAAGWERVLLWLNRVPFGTGPTAVTDPIFGRDISWFLFDLPFLRSVQSVFNTLVLASLLVAFGRYLAGMPRAGFRLLTPVRVHLAILGALFLLSVAFGYQLDKYELVYSNRGLATGVGYTDAHAQFLAYDVLTGLSAFAAAFLVGAAFTRWTWPLGATVAIWLLASILVGGVYPEAIQRFVVVPNQLAQEKPYITNNIAMTRLAYGLESWEERPYRGEAPLTQKQITEDATTFQNARLWAYQPLGDTIDQLQTVRRYYDFVDVDTDRYKIGGGLRQVMLSARELNLAGNPSAVGWVNERIIYTHGIGLVMVPVNDVTTEGQPVLFIKNLPPVSTSGAPAIAEPRIYFGEKPAGYVIVGAKQPEFDYPQGSADASGADRGVQTTWSGGTGIALDTTLKRVLFALRFGDLDLLISDQIRSESQVLMHRTLQERLQLLAPFLRYDKDPYLVVDGSGHLVYIQDAFTTTDRFPNAQGFDPATLNASGLGGRDFDYIRNSVKVVMNAYDGTMRFFVSDPNDPLIRAYEGVFPALFQPMSEMPADLVPHLRVPEELFNVQTRMFGKYHVTDPETFYRTDDQWTVPSGKTSEQSLPAEAYYVVMRMPGEPNPEFLLLQPMVPKDRPNMIAWVAARNDAPNYGAVRYFRFPADTTVLGPEQIEARIDQDPTISAQTTLWNQSGSHVIRGNLIVIPVGESLIYLQPVYLQSTASKFPEFQRIIVASPSTVVWGRTLSESLNLLLAGQGQGQGPPPSGSPGPSPTPAPSATPGSSGAPGLPSDVPGLVAYANQHFELAQTALRVGDFARYGQEIELVRQALGRLDELAGPSPAP
jgi:uncharacterized membrane protein (UPF0182 family)